MENLWLISISEIIIFQVSSLRSQNNDIWVQIQLIVVRENTKEASYILTGDSAHLLDNLWLWKQSSELGDLRSGM